MGSLMQRQKQVELKKRILFFGTESLGLFLALTVSGWLGIPLMGLGAYLGWDWFKFRARNGMRF